MQIWGLGKETLATGAVDGTTTTLQKIYVVESFVHISLQLITVQGAGLTGTWVIEASNNYSPPPSLWNQAANTGDWVDVTTQFTPAVTSPIAGSTNQLVGPTSGVFPHRTLRVTFARTAGNGTASIWLMAKGN